MQDYYSGTTMVGVKFFLLGFRVWSLNKKNIYTRGSHKKDRENELFDRFRWGSPPDINLPFCHETGQKSILFVSEYNCVNVMAKLYVIQQ